MNSPALDAYAILKHALRAKGFDPDKFWFEELAIADDLRTITAYEPAGYKLDLSRGMGIVYHREIITDGGDTVATPATSYPYLLREESPGRSITLAKEWRPFPGQATATQDFYCDRLTLHQDYVNFHLLLNSDTLSGDADGRVFIKILIATPFIQDKAQSDV